MAGIVQPIMDMGRLAARRMPLRKAKESQSRGMGKKELNHLVK